MVDALTRTDFDVIAVTGSTNADLLDRVHAGQAVAEGRWLVADRQQAGRGRHGRIWQDGAGNFMGSTSVLLKRGDPPAHSLALVAGLSVHDVIAMAAPAHDVRLKWPNDLLIGASKVAGCLVERSGDVVVVGVGINLAVAPQISGRSTCALADVGVSFGRDACAAALANAFTRRLAAWRSGGWPASILADWCAAAHSLGTMLTLSDGAQAGLTGAFDGLEQDGSLRLRVADGNVRVVHAGEVAVTGSTVPAHPEHEG